MFGKLSAIASDPIKGPYLVAWGAITGLLLSVVLMWVFNIAGVRGLNIPFAIIGIVLLGFIGFRPTFLVQSAALGGVFSALSGKNPVHGMGNGLGLLYKVVLVITYGFVLSAFTLMTWSFKESPGAFWILFVGVLLLLMWVQVHKVPLTKWVPLLVAGYVVICIAIGLWTTFGGAYNGRSFDPKTGEPAYMVDQTTGAIDKKNRSPAKCRPRGTSYAGFDYATQGTCFSTETGMRLVPMSPDQALRRNPSSWGSLAVETASEAKAPSFGPPWLIPAILAGVVLTGVLLVFGGKANFLKRADVIIGLLIVGGCLVVFNTWVKADASCPAKPSIIGIAHPGTVLYLNPCWDEVYVRTTGVTQYDVRFADESSPRVSGRSPYDFIQIVTSFPGQTADTIKIRPNRQAFIATGIKEIELVFMPLSKPVATAATPEPGMGLDFLSSN